MTDLLSSPSMDALRQPDSDAIDCLTIEDLLDFSSDHIGYGSSVPCHVQDSETQERSPSPPQQKLPSQSEATGAEEVFCTMPSTDEYAELEWLSNFVEESFANGDGTMLETASRKGGGGAEQESKELEEEARSVAMAYESVRNRGGGGRGYRGWRAGACFWNTRILWMEEDLSRATAMAEKRWSGEAMGMGASTSGNSSDSEIGLEEEEEDEEEEEQRIMMRMMMGGQQRGKQQQGKKRKRMGGIRGGSRERRCMHCGSERTPQWRAGPMGPKTLCNACGVRFKSGRLLPEYRPAASPTFTHSLHSNSHRRVLEMRRLRTSSVCEPPLP